MEKEVGKKHWIITVVLFAVFAALLLYGLLFKDANYQNDIFYVYNNATNYCFT